MQNVFSVFKNLIFCLILEQSVLLERERERERERKTLHSTRV